MISQTLKNIDFLSCEGVMSRRQFWYAYLLLAIPNYFAYQFAPFLAPVFYEWLARSFFAFTAILLVFQVVKRLHDTGRSGWMSLLLLIPGLNLYVLYLLFIKR